MHQFHVAAVDGVSRLSAIAAVGEILKGVASGNAVLAGIGGGVVGILQTDWYIPIPSTLHISPVVAHKVAMRRLDEYHRSIGTCCIFSHNEVALHNVTLHRVVDALGDYLPPVIRSFGRAPLRNEEAQPAVFRQGQHSGVILEHHHTCKLLAVALRHKFRTAHSALSLFHVDVGIIKQPCAEHIEQQSPCRLLHALSHPLLAMLSHTHTVSFEHRLFAVVSSKLIHACHESLVVALCLGHSLHAPWLA